MSSFKCVQLTNELAQSLCSSFPPSDVENALIKSKALVPTSSLRIESLTLLSKNSSDSNAVTQKYLEVKSKNYESLGPCMELMALISEDTKLRRYLKKIPKSTPLKKEEKVTENGVSVTTESLQMVKHKLKAASSEIQKTNEVKTDNIINDTRNQINDSSKFPQWFQTQVNLSKDFVLSRSGDNLLPLRGINVDSQENYLVEDVINCLVGVAGKHIKALPLSDPYAKRNFKYSDGIDQSLKELCSKTLELSVHYSLVVRFVEQKYDFKYGRVNNALAAAIDEHIDEYLTFIAQLETQHRKLGLRLQKLNFLVQPMLHKMTVLAYLVQAINNTDAKGGKVLTLLHEHTVRMGGDELGQQLCLQLTKAASKPYLETLDAWIHSGVISDRFDEFLIENNQTENESDIGGMSFSIEDCDGYWERRYTIRRDRVPKFLETQADVILLTGKYLNVIRQCGKKATLTEFKPTEYTLNGKKCEESIEKAYQFASKTLLDILMRDYDLKGRLKWMKHFFLLEQGDFISQFMDACESELQKRIFEIEPTRLESLLGLVLRTSSAASAMGGCYLEELHTLLLNCSLPTQMVNILAIKGDNNNSMTSSGVMSYASGEGEDTLLTGMESFTFKVDVQWPISLVLSSQTLLYYQILFRHLFFIKHVERQLCKVWSSNNVARSFDVSDSTLYRPAFALRQRMLTFVQNLQCYMTSEVIEPNWNKFMERFKTVSSIDEVLICHTDFIDRCLHECMLKAVDLLLPMCQLFDICIKFCSFILGAGTIIRGEESITFEKQISDFEKSFDAKLRDLFKLILTMSRDPSNVTLLNVIYSLDFNNYYSSQSREEGSLSG